LYKVLNGEATAEDYNDPNSALKLLYNDCLTLDNGIKDYQKGSNTLSIANFNIDDPNFPRLYSIFAGCRPSALNRPDKSVYSVSYSQTELMETRWANLETAELEMSLKIITGKEDISAFDAFVEKWNAEGGADITAEVQAIADAS
jgi:multiple sugar transport system substrate-binding protein/putative aldouronate transport system substrate-binding protein